VHRGLIGKLFEAITESDPNGFLSSLLKVSSDILNKLQIPVKIQSQLYTESGTLSTTQLREKVHDLSKEECVQIVASLFKDNSDPEAMK
jgi:hypothetical protein